MGTQVRNTSAGYSVGTAAAQKVGFHGATPVIQRASSAQAAVTALTGTLTGTVDGAIADIAAAAGNCAGTTAPTAGNVDTAIATAVAPIVSGTNTQLKELQTSLAAAIVLINELRAAVVAKGLIKGAA